MTPPSPPPPTGDKDALIHTLREENRRLREALAGRSGPRNAPHGGPGPWASLLVLVLLLALGVAATDLWDLPLEPFSDDAPRRPTQAAQPAKPRGSPPEISTDKQVYRPGEAIEVSFGGLPGSPTDWITIVRQGAPDTQYGAWTYTQGRKVGRHAFKPLSPGEYEARVYYDWSQGGYEVQGRHAFSVQAETPEPAVKPVDGPRPSGVKVQARLTFDGRPLPQTTATLPRFWFRNEDTGKEAKPVAEYQEGRLELSGLEGSRMGIQTRVDRVASNPTDYPGDLYDWTTFLVPAQEGTVIEIPLAQVIHLTAPQDNGAPMEGWDLPCMERPAVDAPVEIAWEGLGDAVDYEIEVKRVDCVNNLRTLETVLLRRLPGTSLKAQLPPSDRDEMYTLTLKASRAGVPIGQLITHGRNGMGWDYRFRVKGG